MCGALLWSGGIMAPSAAMMAVGLLLWGYSVHRVSKWRVYYIHGLVAGAVATLCGLAGALFHYLWVDSAALRLVSSTPLVILMFISPERRRPGAWKNGIWVPHENNPDEAGRDLEP